MQNLGECLDVCAQNPRSKVQHAKEDSIGFFTLQSFSVRFYMQQFFWNIVIVISILYCRHVHGNTIPVI